MWKRFWIKGIAPAILIATLMGVSTVQAACLDWSDARSVIKRNKLLKAGEVRRRAQEKGNEVVTINLCRRGGRYIYRLTVIGKKKRVRDVIVDARGGQKVKRPRSSGGSSLKNRIINRVRRNLRRHGINY